MRSVALVLSCVLALSLHAQSWELGSTELRRTPWKPRMLGAAASNRMHLATWVEDPEFIYAARYSSAGEVLDPAGLYIGTQGYFWSPRTASDGEDFLVAWESDRAELRTTRITAGGEVILSDWSVKHATPLALASNGRSYLLIYARHQKPNEAVLLDRNGVAISGTLTLPATQWSSLAPRGGMWLLALREQDSRGLVSWRSAEIFETDFPRVGETRAVELAPLFESERPSLVAIAGSPRGFVSARVLSTAYRKSEIVVRWHAGDVRTRRIPRHDVETRISIADGITDLAVAMDGSAAYVTYRLAPPCYGCESVNAAVLRVAGDDVDELVPATRRDAAVSVSSLGAAALWIDEKDRQVYASRAGGATLAPPQHVSQRLPTHGGSRLVSGAGVHLALWHHAGRQARLAYAILSDEGEPLTPQLDVGESAYEGPFAATDGQSFFVLWSRGNDWRGCIIAPDGTITGGPFDVDLGRIRFVESFLWDGTSYLAGITGSEVVRISPQGAVTERVRVTHESGTSIRLLPLNEGFVALVWRSHKIGCLCGYQLSATAVPLDRNLKPDDAREDPWRGQEWHWWSWYARSTIAAGEGHRLIIRDDDWGDEGLHAIGDDGETRELPYGQDLQGDPSAKWDGEEFLVAAGPVLARHAPDGTFRSITALPPDTLASDVAVDRNRVPIVLTERYVGRTRRLLVTRLRTASSESGPATP